MEQSKSTLNSINMDLMMDFSNSNFNNSFNLTIETEIDFAIVNSTTEMEIKNIGNRKTSPINLTTTTSYSPATAIRAVKNREIRLIFRSNKNSTSNGKQRTEQKYFSIEHSEQSNISYINMKINKDLFILAASIAGIILVAFSVISCLYRFAGPSHTDALFMCRYPHHYY